MQGWENGLLVESGRIEAHALITEIGHNWLTQGQSMVEQEGVETCGNSG
jgi:hypothetical protein